MRPCTIRPYAPADRDAVNAVALAAFAQYSGDYQDWPSFADGIARMADLAEVGEVLVAGVAPALRMYLERGFERDADLPPERGVPYGRYVLPASAFGQALRLLEAG